MERQHIALTEAQIIAAEKGEIQLEYMNGEKVCQVVWFKPPYNQDSWCIWTVNNNGKSIGHIYSGTSSYGKHYDLFVSEQDVESELPNDFMKVGEHKTIEGAKYIVCEDEKPDDCYGCDLGEEACRRQKHIKCCNTILKRVEPSPKPLYEVGEMIEVEYDIDEWVDAELRDSKDGHIAVWHAGCYRFYVGEKHHRKKQTEKTVTLENKVMTVKEAFKYLTNL